VDQDAEIEEQLFARALAPQRLAAAFSGLPVIDDGGGGFDLPSGNFFAGAFGDVSLEGMTPQFDADFEEIMRRFDEDDRQASSIDDMGPGVRPIVDLVMDSEASHHTSKSSGEAAAPPPPSVLQFDASTLLDDSMGVGFDEDDLLNSIQDIPSL